MIIYLISTTEFVRLIGTNGSYTKEELIRDYWELVVNYVNLISQRPELWMFIGNNTLFKGWKLDDEGITTIDDNPDNWLRITDNNVTECDTLEELIEELNPYLQLELTETALKQIGL